MTALAAFLGAVGALGLLAAGAFLLLACLPPDLPQDAEVLEAAVMLIVIATLCVLVALWLAGRAVP